jgi:hypothetical protein
MLGRAIECMSRCALFHSIDRVPTEIMLEEVAKRIAR